MPFLTRESWRDLIQTDILSMGQKEIPAQFLDAILFVQSCLNSTKFPDLTVQNTALTGHSLGGALATAVSYTFGFQALGYNPFGIAKNDLFNANTIGDVFRTAIESILPNYVGDPTTVDINNIQNTGLIYEIAGDLNVSVGRLIDALNSTQPVTEIVTDNINIVSVGKDYQEFVSGAVTDLVGGLIGDFKPVMNHEGGGLWAHGIAGLNESIKVQSSGSQIFIVDIKDSGEKLREIGNRFGVGPSAITEAGRLFPTRMEKDEDLAKRVENIKAMLKL